MQYLYTYLLIDIMDKSGRISRPDQATDTAVHTATLHVHFYTKYEAWFHFLKQHS